jgi:GrpB-like predicted nucleotidyltransferase (UPF0157 family)
MADQEDAAAYGHRLAEVTVGVPERLSGPIVLCDHDPRWAERYEREAARIRRVLGARVRRLEHVGSTSVPGLAAKPIVDIVVEVADSSDEPRYIPPLRNAGYALRVREPDWFEHRLLKGGGGAVNLHVFSAGCAEVERMVHFRDWLRGNRADRELYARGKRELAAREWTYVQQYADAKSEVIAAILTRALAQAQ